MTLTRPAWAAGGGGVGEDGGQWGWRERGGVGVGGGGGKKTEDESRRVAEALLRLVLSCSNTRICKWRM